MTVAGGPWKKAAAGQADESSAEAPKRPIWATRPFSSTRANPGTRVPVFRGTIQNAGAPPGEHASSGTPASTPLRAAIVGSSTTGPRPSAVATARRIGSLSSRAVDVGVDIVRVGDGVPILPHYRSALCVVRVPGPRIVDVQLLVPDAAAKQPPRVRISGTCSRVPRDTALHRPQQVDLIARLLPSGRRVEAGIEMVAGERLVPGTLVGRAATSGRIAQCRGDVVLRVVVAVVAEDHLAGRHRTVVVDLLPFQREAVMRAGVRVSVVGAVLEQARHRPPERRFQDADGARDGARRKH